VIIADSIVGISDKEEPAPDGLCARAVVKGAAPPPKRGCEMVH